MSELRLNCQSFGRRTLSVLPGSPAGLTERENANKGFIISWPFHTRRHLPRYDEGAAASLAALFPSVYHLLLSSTPTYFQLLSLIICLSISITLGPNEGLFPLKCVRGTGDGDDETTSCAPALPLTFLVSLSIYTSLCALLSLFRCLPVHLTVGIKELSLNCCHCQWLSCLPWVSTLPASSPYTGINEPCGGNDGYQWTEEMEWQRGAKVWCTWGKGRGGGEREREQQGSRQLSLLWCSLTHYGHPAL